MCSIEDRQTGCRVRTLGSDAKRLHGLRAARLLILDESAKLDAAKVDPVFVALHTSVGKIEHAKLVLIGTRPARPDHPFSRLLGGSGDFVREYSAGPDDDPFAEASHGRRRTRRTTFSRPFGGRFGGRPRRRKRTRIP